MKQRPWPVVIWMTLVFCGTGSQGLPVRCYGALGCLWTGYPWSWLLRPVPDPAPRESVNATFYVFSAREDDPILLPTQPDVSFEGIPFHNSWKTIFITHGYRGSVLNEWPEEMARIIVSKGNYNVIAVDWSQGAADITYIPAVSNARIAGAEMSRVMLHLMNECNVSKENLHLVGHSLGAHACSYAANSVGGVGRITGLDAAQPLFEEYREKQIILDQSDACFVDAIHTDAKSSIPDLGMGYISPYGDIDFYVNGGAHQPGCSEQVVVPDKIRLADILTIPAQLLDIVSCSHQRGHFIYADALRNETCTMWGRRVFSTSNVKSFGEDNELHFNSTPVDCELYSCTPLGFDTIKYPARGLFFLETTGRQPFCIPDPETDMKMSLKMAKDEKSQIRNMCATKGIALD